MTKDRQKMILRLIEEEIIETQEDLIGALKKKGFETTQATISRDIRKLRLTKVPTGTGAYRYIAPKSEEVSFGSGFRAMVSEGVRSVVAAQNIIVLHTNPGLAQPVALGIDTLGVSELLGCVAGDDTVLVVTKDAESASRVAESLHDLLKTI